MIDNIYALALALTAGASMVFAIWRAILLRRALRIFDNAKQREANTHRGLVKSGELAKAFDAGFNSRNGEIRWYALYCEGRDELVNELKVKLSNYADSGADIDG